MNKKGFEVSFAWLFAIIVGAFILFLTIYGVTKLISLERTSMDAELGKQIGVLLNPLETGFESGSTTSFTVPSETRIRNRCSVAGNFGMQTLPISQKNFGEWTDTRIDASFPNKYIFSEDIVDGKKFFLFSKQFNFPFKVADLVYLSSANTKYCFKDAPEEIKEDLELLSQDNILIDNCTGNRNEIKVCFNEEGCDIYVNYQQEYVDKESGRNYFILPSLGILGKQETGLMYAAIFTDKDLYDCQLKRIMKRVEQLCEIYKDKKEFISRVNCNSNVNLGSLEAAANRFSESSDLVSMQNLVEDIDDKNRGCVLW